MPGQVIALLLPDSPLKAKRPSPQPKGPFYFLCAARIYLQLICRLLPCLLPCSPPIRGPAALVISCANASGVNGLRIKTVFSSGNRNLQIRLPVAPSAALSDRGAPFRVIPLIPGKRMSVSSTAMSPRCFAPARVTQPLQKFAPRLAQWDRLLHPAATSPFPEYFLCVASASRSAASLTAGR